MYKTLIEKNNAIIISGKELPYVSMYIGHNSSLLSKALQISGQLILWHFKEEPELFYKDFAMAVCTNKKQLSESIEDALNNKSDNRKKEIEMYSYKNPVGAYHYCAEKIISLNNN